MLGAVGLLLLTGCADVAGLLLIKAATRSKEMAIRMALGAVRIRLIRQTLTESLLLAFTGGLLGLLLAAWVLDFLPFLLPVSIPRINEIRISSTVLGCSMLVSMCTAVLFGVIPALRSSHTDLIGTVREDSHTVSSGGHQKLPFGILVASQFAIAVILSIGAGLLVRSFGHLVSTDPGFKAEQAVTMSISLPAHADTWLVGAREAFYNHLDPRQKHTARHDRNQKHWERRVST